MDESKKPETNWQQQQEHSTLHSASIYVSSINKTQLQSQMQPPAVRKNTFSSDPFVRRELVVRDLFRSSDSFADTIVNDLINCNVFKSIEAEICVLKPAAQAQRSDHLTSFETILSNNCAYYRNEGMSSDSANVDDDTFQSRCPFSSLRQGQNFPSYLSKERQRA